MVAGYVDRSRRPPPVPHPGPRDRRAGRADRGHRMVRPDHRRPAHRMTTDRDGSADRRATTASLRCTPPAAPRPDDRPVPAPAGPAPMTQGWEIAVAVIGLALSCSRWPRWRPRRRGGAVRRRLGVAARHRHDRPHPRRVGHRAPGPRTARRPIAGVVAGPAATYLCVAVCELLVIAGTRSQLASRSRSALRNDGMATRREAEQVLGSAELRGARDDHPPRPLRPAAEQAARRRRGSTPEADP